MLMFDLMSNKYCIEYLRALHYIFIINLASIILQYSSKNFKHLYLLNRSSDLDDSYA
jgi:hypothetical protein